MKVKAYGDTIDDGAVQLSFTLPLDNSAKAFEAARQFVLKLGFKSCEIAHAEPLTDGFTMFVAYGKTDVCVNPDEIHVEESPVEKYMSFDEIDEFIKKRIGRKIVVVGACTGFDAHTVGIDSIINTKGYNHHWGLERYSMIEAHNLGAQVSNEELIEYAKKIHADAILVSQVVTQREVHIENLSEFVDLIDEENIRENVIIVAGGPRIDLKLATELGFDGGFGKGTYAEHVATFIVRKMADRSVSK